MFKLPVSKLKAGMILGQSLFNKTGGSYLVKGQAITIDYIRALKRIGIQDVAVTSVDPSYKPSPPEDIIEERTRVAAIAKVYETFQEVEQNNQFEVPQLQKIADQILFNLFDKHENLAQLTDLRSHDNYTFAHSVNVAVLSAMIGMMAHYPKEDLLILTLGALLHDIGKIHTPLHILNKPRRLTCEEFDIIQRHPADGYKRLIGMRDIPKTSIIAAIAGQHHEHLDGSGYPSQRKGDAIHRFAQIVTIADVYDALTSERPYKKGYTPHVAYDMMTKIHPKRFAKDLLKLFFDNVAIYPVGSIVKTIYGFGVVKKITFGRTTTPTLLLFADNDMTLLPRRQLLDLCKDPAGASAIELVPTGNELYHILKIFNVDPTQFLLEEDAEPVKYDLPPLPFIPPLKV